MMSWNPKWIPTSKEEKKIKKLEEKQRIASKCIRDLKANRDQLNEELERAYTRLNEKNTEIRNLKGELYKQKEIIRVQFEIINSYKELCGLVGGKVCIR